MLSGDLAQEISDLKQRVEGVILVAGSARLVQALLAHGLVDELRLDGIPGRARSGQGACSPRPPDKQRLALRESRTVGNGIAILIYEPEHAA